MDNEKSLEIGVENIGPITEFSAELKIGLNVLVGRQGAGKSTILRTIGLVIGDDPAPVTKRDGTSGSGVATIGGRTIKISKTTRKEGELGVEGVGSVDLAGLHSPRFEKPEARDKARIKALLGIAGVTGGINMFRARLVEAIGDEAADKCLGKAVVSPSMDATEVATKVKTAIDAMALDLEREAAVHTGAAEEASKGIVGAKSSVPIAEAKEAARAARENVGKVKAGKEASDKMLEMIDGIIRDIGSCSDEELEMEISSLNACCVDSQAKRDQLSRQVAEIDEDIEKLRSEKRQVEEEAEKERAKAVAASSKKQELMDLLSATRAKRERAQKMRETAVVTKEHVEAAEAEAARCGEIESQAIAAANDGVLAVKAEEAKQAAKKADRLSRKLRDATATVAASLADAVGKIDGCPLAVQFNEDGIPRLYQGKEPFDRLSDGQRWATIIAMAARMSTILVIPQSAFGEMSPDTRSYIEEQVTLSGCMAVTAVAQDTDLCLMSYSKFQEVGVV